MIEGENYFKITEVSILHDAIDKITHIRVLLKNPSRLSIPIIFKPSKSKMVISESMFFYCGK